MSEIGIVGAGLSGLTAATELAAAGHHVTVFDRVPVSGGVLGYKDPLARELTDEAATAGATLSLGTTALRWSDGRLLIAGPAGIGWRAAQRLIICTGQRPRTLAEMHVAGPRLSGVLPVTAAVHLLEAGARLGRRIVVLGDGWWSRRLGQAGRLRHPDRCGHRRRRRRHRATPPRPGRAGSRSACAAPTV